MLNVVLKYKLTLSKGWKIIAFSRLVKAFKLFSRQGMLILIKFIELADISCNTNIRIIVPKLIKNVN